MHARSWVFASRGCHGGDEVRMSVNIYGVEVEEVSWGGIIEGAAAVAAMVTKKVEGKVSNYTSIIKTSGTMGETPVDTILEWSYPTSESTVTIDVMHVRVVDDVQIHFDFEAHEWVAKQELQAKSDHEPATGIWIEVARWSGNAPTAISSVESGTVETKAEEDDP